MKRTLTDRIYWFVFLSIAGFTIQLIVNWAVYGLFSLFTDSLLFVKPYLTLHALIFGPFIQLTSKENRKRWL